MNRKVSNFLMKAQLNSIDLGVTNKIFFEEYIEDSGGFDGKFDQYSIILIADNGK